MKQEPEYIEKNQLIRDLIDTYGFYPAVVKAAIAKQPVVTAEELSNSFKEKTNACKND